MLKATAKYVDITEFSCRERFIDPTYFSPLDRDSNLISKGKAVELVGEPFAIKWCRFKNAKVCAVNRQLTDTFIIILEPFGKNDLKLKKE